MTTAVAERSPVTTSTNEPAPREAPRRAAQPERFGPVFVFDGDQPTALAIVRSLGRAGIPVIVCSHKKTPVARFSRYASGFRQCPALDDIGAFRPWLEEQLKSGQIQIVAPTSDALCFHLAELRHLFPKPVQDALPTKDQLLDCLMKDRFEHAVVRAGAKTPRSWSPMTRAEAAALAESLPYPVVLKPKSHIGVNLRGQVVRSKAELLEHFRDYEVPPGHEGVLSRYPGITVPLIQEYVPGALENLYSVSGVIGADGRVVALAASKKVSQWPPSLGVGLLFESCTEARVLEVGAQIAEDVLGKGLFELELILDARTDELLAIDLNPRAYGQMALDIARGNDLPLMWYRMATGEHVESIGQARRVARFVHGIPYAIEQTIGLLKGPARVARIKSWAKVVTKKHVDIVNEWSDPLPTLPYTATIFRHPRALVRAFLSPGR